MANNSITLDIEPARAWYQAGHIMITLTDGRSLSFPVADNPRLRCGTPEQLADIELSYDGLHWPELDEDLSIGGILRGDHGQ